MAAAVAVAAVAGVLVVHRDLPRDPPPEPPATPATTGATTEPADPVIVGVPDGPERRPRWTARGAGPGWDGSSPERGPVRAGRLVLTATGFRPPGRVSAFDAATGRLRWRHRTGGTAFIRAVTRRLVVVGPERGELVGLDPETGRRRWRFRFPPAHAAFQATAAAGHLYVGTVLAAEGRVPPPLVYGLELATGRPRWRAVLRRGTAVQWAAPVVAAGNVLVATTPLALGGSRPQALHALDAATGLARWQTDLPTAEPGFHNERALFHRGRLVVPALGSLLALEPANGYELWRRPAGPWLPQLVGAAGPLVLALLRDALVAVGTADGRERWRLPLAAGEHRWVALAAGRVYALAGGLVRALDPRTGAELWRSGSGPAVGSPLRLGDRLYVATVDGLVALEAASGRLAWTGGRRRLIGGPIAAGGRVVVMTGPGDLLGYAP